MTFDSKVANVIWTFGSIALLWATCRYLLIPAIRDTVRYRLFSIRREMFLFMATGKISADNAAYGHVRMFLNRAIRYVDILSLARTIVGVAIAGKFGKEHAREVERSISSLPPDVKRQMQDFRQRAALVLGVHAIIRSPLGWVLFVAMVPVATLFALIALLRSASARPWLRIRQALANRAEEETQIIRCIEEEGLAAA